MVQDEAEKIKGLLNSPYEIEVVAGLLQINNKAGYSRHFLPKLKEMARQPMGISMIYSLGMLSTLGKMDAEIKLIIRKLLVAGMPNEITVILSHLKSSPQSIKFAKKEILLNVFSPELEYHYRAVCLLSKLLPLPKKTLKRLSQLLEDNETRAVEIIEIAKVLGEVGSKASFAIPSLIKAISNLSNDIPPEDGRETIEAVLNTIYVVAKKNPEHKAALLQVAKEKDRFMRKYIEIFAEEKM